MKLNVKTNGKLVINALARIQSDLKNLSTEVYKEFVKNTPIDKGNARENTRLVRYKKIVADYPYAVRLNNGWSKQAPKGMVKPTEEWLKRRIKQIVRKR